MRLTKNASLGQHVAKSFEKDQPCRITLRYTEIVMLCNLLWDYHAIRDQLEKLGVAVTKYSRELFLLNKIPPAALEKVLAEMIGVEEIDPSVKLAHQRIHDTLVNCYLSLEVDGVEKGA